ncbi:MAG: hypothetical protein QF921_18050 [Pseudomonadales bacterium]|nr:hypothetical protein [Pseudomonadales bacterium]MDP6470445.1 hypothetical protein [Pseudomonadales bacterium]MDP6827746.1 hypothetical protein [Pseudomonadales bacterium]MDP6973389.1 hypothetical protein [Pseudomonadales bacterium]
MTGPTEPRDPLERLQCIARPLTPLRYVPLAAAFAFAALFLVSALDIEALRGEAPERYTIPALLGVLWSLAIFSFIVSFREVPPPVPQDAGLVARLRVRFARAYYWLLAGSLAFLTFAVAYLSYRLLSVWSSDFTTP